MGMSFRQQVEADIQGELKRSSRFQRGLVVSSFALGVGIGVVTPELPVDVSSKIPVTVTVAGIAMAAWHRRRTLQGCNGFVSQFERGRVGPPHASAEELKDDFANGIATIVTPMIGTLSGYLTHTLVEQINSTGEADALLAGATALFTGLTALGGYMTNYMERDAITAYREQLDAIDGHH